MDTGLPPWHRLSGIKRIASEFKYLRRCIDERKVSQITNLTTVDEKAAVWRFELSNFDDSIPAGQQLNSDLKQLKLRYGQNFLLMEVNFPEAYPHEPLFLRVVSPRCIWYTGHVTAGGAICLEVLTNTGSSNGWRPDFCVESILQIAILNMLHTESVTVRTASGPGGRSGPLRCARLHPDIAYQDHFRTESVQNWSRYGYCAITSSNTSICYVCRIKTTCQY